MNMDAVMIRREFAGMTDDRLKEWSFILADEIANGPRKSVRLTFRELEILQSVMAERGVTL